MQIPRQDLQGVVLLSLLTILGFFQPTSAHQTACYNVSALTVSDISARVLGESALLWDHDVHWRRFNWFEDSWHEALNAVIMTVGLLRDVTWRGVNDRGGVFPSSSTGPPTVPILILLH